VEAKQRRSASTRRISCSTRGCLGLAELAVLGGGGEDQSERERDDLASPSDSAGASVAWRDLQNLAD